MSRIKRRRRLIKMSQQTDGILSQQPVNIETRDLQRNVDRSESQSNLYGLSFEKEEYKLPEGMRQASSLSTRYVPGMPGVQAQKVPGESNVFKDPHSGKVFDYNEGFVDDNVAYNPQGVHFQTSTMYSYAKEISEDFKKKGLFKEARIIKTLFSK